jgi:L-malate glycosyltransferase
MNSAQRRVLIVGPSLRYLGGQSVQAARLLEGLTELHGLDVAYQVVDPALPKPFHLLQRVPIIRTAITSVVYIAMLLVRLPHVDVVHIFSAAYWSFLLAPAPALLLGRLFGKRVLLNYHSGEADDHLARWGWHARPMMRLADQIIVPTAYLVDVFQRHGMDAIAIANHVDVARMQSRTRSSLRPIFLSNRNLELHYNVQAIVGAFAQVQRMHPDAQLIIVGDGSQRSVLESLVGSLGLRNVRFVGAVQPSTMPAHYDAADVYVNASLIDNMPLSLLEAYASRLPVITSNAGGIPWIAAEGITARVVPAGDVDALAVAMLETLADPGAAVQRAAQAYDFVTSQFAWSCVGAAWERAYTGVLPA